MNGIRYIMQVMRSCFRTWRNAPRMMMILGMLACFEGIYSVSFVENARAMGQTLQVSELFIAMMNWRFALLMFGSMILLMYGDLPIVERFTVNAIMKGTRRQWVLGQMGYVVLTSLMLAVFVFVVSVVLCLPDVHFDNTWSKPVKMLALGSRTAIPLEEVTLSFRAYLVKNYTPWGAFGHAFLQFFLLGCFYGMASIALRIRIKSASFVVLMVVNVLSWATGMFAGSDKIYGILSFFSIGYHTSLVNHEYEEANALLPSLGVSYAIMIALIGLFVGLALVYVRKYDYGQMEVEHT